MVARVRGFHGLAGTVRLESLTDRAAERFTPGSTLFAEGEDSPLTIAAAEPDALGWRVRFVELPDRTAAERLRDAYLEAVVESDETLADGEFYWHQIVGSLVSDADGAELGRVTDVYRAGGAEVMLVSGPAGEIDVPLVRAFISVFEPDKGRIVVDGAALGLHGKPADEADGA